MLEEFRIIQPEGDKSFLQVSGAQKHEHITDSVCVPSFKIIVNHCTLDLKWEDTFPQLEMSDLAEALNKTASVLSVVKFTETLVFDLTGK